MLDILTVATKSFGVPIGSSNTGQFVNVDVIYEFKLTNAINSILNM
jgi:hypothetical protein